MSAPQIHQRESYAGMTADLFRARLAYIERHGARFLFDNTRPPAPGWPVLRMGRVVRV